MDSATKNVTRGRKSEGKRLASAGGDLPKKSRKRGERGGTETKMEKTEGTPPMPLPVSIAAKPFIPPPPPPKIQNLVALLEGKDCSVEFPILKDITKVAFCNARLTSEIHEKVLKDAVGVFLWDNIQLSAEVLGKFRSLKIIVKLGPGLQNIDLDAASSMGIAVCHVDDDGIEECSDTVLALLLELYRKNILLDKKVREGMECGNFETVSVKVMLLLYI